VDKWNKDTYDGLLERKRKWPDLYPQPVEPPSKRDPNISPNLVQRLDAGMYIIYNVLARRPADSTDRYAIARFDNTVFWVETLNKDRDVVMESVTMMKRNSGGGTNFDTEEGAIQGCINQFKNEGQATMRVMVFVSDGDAGISPERHEYFVKQFTKPQPWHKGKNVKHAIFFLVAGPKENFQRGGVAEQMMKLCKEVNPDPTKDKNVDPRWAKAARWVGDGKEMTEAIEMLNDLTKSPIEEDPVAQERHIRHEVLLAAAIMLAGCMLCCVVFRESL